VNLNRLTIAPAASPGNVFAAVDFIDGEDGPIVARLWYDDTLSAAIAEPDTLAALVANQAQAVGWLFWAIDEEVGSSPDETWQPRVYLLGPNVSMPDALACSLALLEEWEPECAHTRASSLHELGAMAAAEVEYSLMPAPLAADAKNLRRQRWSSLSAVGRR
jgi:hypothetical protein